MSKDKWLWVVAWSLSTGALVGFGMLGPGAHPWIGWGNALAGGLNVLMGVAMGVLLGLGIRQGVLDRMMECVISSDARYEHERREHEKTADVLFDLAYGVTEADAARAYLAELDAAEEEDPVTEESH